MRGDEKRHTKAVPGVKGIRCPCCREHGTMHEVKTMDSRLRRRTQKQIDKKELLNERVEDSTE